ncbi:Zn-dependent membrane protease YugP [Clostridium algifaecis]|uniref:Zn-dependent membrane protease YugP n=1 Tax=Clostridium algifaecis TaxID=1472040 RepID=A0ABS4KNJ0_9CLOT|nr:zinc metallopeptidase [Clostridium algifaecis]MBP2031606.1 Zn-dependent membrane protease YugP [Clostridium algifaecis]
MFYFDRSFIILIPALLVAAYAQYKVSSTFNNYSRYTSRNGYTGSQVARMLLDASGLYDVPVELIPGKLSDHYDPGARVMRLSQEVYYGNSVASIGVAAHETGHAIQHKERYFPLVLRNSIVPIANFGSNASWILFILGFMFGIRGLVSLGIILFTGVVVFQLVTLPVELNASSRALKILERRSILYGDELEGARKVLGAAAMTYVAAALTAIANLLRLIYISRDRD